jgi:hypothetical protein
MVMCASLLFAGLAGCTDGDDTAQVECTSEPTFHQGDRYTRQADEGCRFVSESGGVLRRTCFEWSELAPSRGEIDVGCGEPDFLVDDFIIEECEDGEAIYFSPQLGGISLVGDPLGPFLTTEEELEASIGEAQAACQRR